MSARLWLVRTLRDDRRGAAAVEFAIIFPLLAVLAFGAIDFGRAFYLRNSLITAAREGARLGASQTDLCTQQGPLATDMRNRTRSAFTDSTALTNGYITVTVTPSNIAQCQIGPTDVRVSITNFPFTPITPVMRLIGRPGSIAISIAASYRFDHADN
jgi:Flp pilus assembly protein TadG